MKWWERVIQWLEKNEHPRKETEKMSYVPVQLWVPDTAEGGAITDAVKLKPCDTCHALIPMELMDDHVAKQHPTLEATPH